MSTKTSIKRIALVAVSALGFGMVSTVPANAADAEVNSGTVTTINLKAATANNGNTGTAQRFFFGSTQVAQGAPGADALFITYRAALTSFPAGGFLVPTGDKDAVGGVAILTLTDEDSAAETGNSVKKTLTATTAVTAETKTATGTTGLGSFTFNPSVAGTYTLTVWNDQNGDNNIGAAEAQSSIAVTVTAPVVAGFSASLTTARFTSDLTDANDVTDAEEAASVTAFSKTNGDSAGIEVKLANTANAAWSLTGVTVSASVTGSGLLNVSTTDTITAANAAVAATLRTASITDATDDVVVILGSDGTSGSGTYTISVSDGTTTTVIKTVTVTWYGAAATLTAAQRLKIAPAAGGTLGGLTSTTYAAMVTIKDASGIGVRGVTPTTETSASLIMATSGTCTASNSAGVSYCDVDSAATAKSGNSADLNFTDGTIDSNKLTFNIGGTASTLKFSLDASSYEPGVSAKLTITATDSSGNPATDGQVLAAGDLTSNLSSQGLPNSAAVSTVNGSATVSLYAPANSGTWTVTNGTVSVSATVSGATDAAIDAANEATDAANAATDAANAAAEAADAATAAAQDAQAAVAALATQVASLVAGIKAQITTLTNLVIKIQKKVRA